MEAKGPLPSGETECETGRGGRVGGGGGGGGGVGKGAEGRDCRGRVQVDG